MWIIKFSPFVRQCEYGCAAMVGVLPWWVCCHGGCAAMVGVLPWWVCCHGGCAAMVGVLHKKIQKYVPASRGSLYISYSGYNIPQMDDLRISRLILLCCYITESCIDELMGNSLIIGVLKYTGSFY